MYDTRKPLKNNLSRVIIGKWSETIWTYLIKKNVSTLYAPFVIVWNRNSFSTTFLSSMLSEYLNTMIQVWPLFGEEEKISVEVKKCYYQNYSPRITQAIDMALSPWMEGIVSLPTRLSQIALKLVTIENDNRSSDHTPTESRENVTGIQKIFSIDCIIEDKLTQFRSKSRRSLWFVVN